MQQGFKALFIAAFLLFFTILPVYAADILPVPFTSQAPAGDWSQPYQDFCEEASIVKAAREPPQKQAPIYEQDSRRVHDQQRFQPSALHLGGGDEEQREADGHGRGLGGDVKRFLLTADVDGGHGRVNLASASS